MFYKAYNKEKTYTDYIKENVLEWYKTNNGTKIECVEWDVYPKYNVIVNEPNFDIRNIRKDDTLMETSFALRKAIKKYDEKNTKQIKLKLNYNTDKDIINWLDTIDNIQGTIKNLIRKEISKNNNSID